MHPTEQQSGLYCHYPPRLVEELDITEQIESGVTRYLVRNTATSRYFLLKAPEYRVLSQLDGTRTLVDVAGVGRQGGAPSVSVATLVRFLSKLDSLGLLARGGTDSVAAHRPSRGLYIRFHLFNPDRLLIWLDRTFGWVLTKPVIAGSFVLMFLVAFGMVARFDEVSTYTAYVYDEYGIAAIVAAILTITLLHEFAHGLACKHFGGDVREMGVLLIYYVLPAFYCNVTDIYRVGRKRERLWVIFAGIYWQLAVSAAGGLFWLLATPYTLFADLAFLTFAGGTFNILINCNPLIKLDGYYALSQALGVVNLQSRSSAYVRGLLARLLGEPRDTKADAGRPMLYVTYWLCSLVYSLILIWLVLGWIGGELMDALRFIGVLLTLILALLLTERWWKPILIRARMLAASSLTRVFPDLAAGGAGRHILEQSETKREGVHTMSTEAAEKPGNNQENVKGSTGNTWLPKRRKVIKLAFAVVVIAVLLAPWEASTGSDCTLVLPPEREGVVRANTNAVLAEVYVQPGDTVNEGARIARLSNPEIEDRLTQLTSEIDRLNNNNSRIEEDLRVRSENMLSANFKEFERKRLASELKIESNLIAAASTGAQRLPSAQPLPPSLAVLQSEIDLKQIELEHNRREVDRYKKLFDQGLVGEQMYDRSVAEARLSEAALRTARSRLDAALVDHHRLTTGAETNSLVAETESRAARSNFESLIAELHSNRQQLESLRQRYEILKRESEGMATVAPKSGVVLGEDLRKMVGRHYDRGEEICRVGEIGKFLLEIDVSEREIASVRLESPVRFKLKTVPGRVFAGRVSKINAEPIPNQRAQRFYAVEVVVENSDGLLRPGMTGFARISFGRQSIGLILAQKVWQTLRPELWLF
ncbi:MAG TPA: efflux RND transporter periplasmic adaptor subunit [Blastocatellia bacterium]|nr:efflux RND transporter periplasmic adaptor subunit [Blastocatellia bacterium]